MSAPVRLSTRMTRLMSRNCLFVSDLHHFSRRAQRRRYEQAVRDAVKHTDVLVLGGDIFDFKWSTLPTHQETVQAAGDWLRTLLEENSDCEVKYVLGNHDHDPLLMAELDRLAGESNRFEWQPYHLRLGNSLFLHGDVADRQTTHDQLVAKRQAWSGHRRPHPLRHHMYDWAVQCHLHRLPPLIVHPHRSVARRMLYYLDRHPHLNRQGIQRVYFGHTHVLVDGFEYRGVRFFNGGAPMNGLPFRLIEADLS